MLFSKGGNEEEIMHEVENVKFSLSTILLPIQLLNISYR